MCPWFINSNHEFSFRYLDFTAACRFDATRNVDRSHSVPRPLPEHRKRAREIKGTLSKLIIPGEIVLFQGISRTGQ